MLDSNDSRFGDVVTEARRGAEKMRATRLLDQLDEIEGIAPEEAARA